MHFRNSFFSQTYTKSLNQKATETHFLFLLFKIPFLELRPSLRIRKSFHKCQFLTFQNAYMFECKLFTDPNTTSHKKIIRIPLAFVHKKDTSLVLAEWLPFLTLKLSVKLNCLLSFKIYKRSDTHCSII